MVYESIPSAVTKWHKDNFEWRYLLLQQLSAISDEDDLRNIDSLGLGTLLPLKVKGGIYTCYSGPM